MAGIFVQNSPISNRITELVAHMCDREVYPKGFSDRQIADALNAALEREGFFSNPHQKVEPIKPRAINTRRQNYSIENPGLPERESELPELEFDLDPNDPETFQGLWNQSRIKIVADYHQRSRATAVPSELSALHEQMVQAIAETTDEAVTTHALNMVVRQHRKAIGYWGMPEEDQKQYDLEVIDMLRSDGKSFPSKREFCEVVGPQLASKATSPEHIKKRLKKIGVSMDEFIVRPGSREDFERLSKSARKYAQFAEIWNNKRIRVRHEIQQALRDKAEVLPDWKSVWKQRGRYKEYQKKHPELSYVLPTLIIRQYNTGEPKELHPFVEQHLDEWKYDRKRIKKAKGFVVGNYQWGAVPNVEFVAALKVYAAYRGFEFIVGLSQYGRIEQRRDTDELLTVLPEELKGHIVVDDVMLADFKLDCNTHLVQTSDVYLTDSVCEIAGEQSTIFLGTKQEMRHWMRLEHDYPACYMTTGSLNYPHHKRTRLGKNNKAVAVARKRHEYAFVVLEVVKDKEHGDFTIPRQLWATEEGDFYDIDAVHGGARLFTPTGHEHHPDGVDTQKDGDLHEAGVDEEIWNITHENDDSISNVLCPKHVHLGDTFDNKWGNPFRARQTVRAAYQASHSMNDIRAELERTKERLIRLREVLPERTETITHEPSNHSDDWLQKWINRGDLQEDPLNSPLLCEMWLAVYNQLQAEGRSIADKDAVEEKSPFGLWLKRELDFIQCPSYQELDQIMRPLPGPDVLRRVFMSHGHIGPKGMDTRSIRAFAAFNKKASGGHVHSATRLNGHDQVGVMTGLKKHYVRGPKTNWTNSHQCIFKNGFAAHLFIIHGRWYGDDVKKARKKLQKSSS